MKRYLSETRVPLLYTKLEKLAEVGGVGITHFAVSVHLKSDFFFLFAVLGMEYRALHILGNVSISEIFPQPLKIRFFIIKSQFLCNFYFFSLLCFKPR
jgi:hypothetical protein